MAVFLAQTIIDTRLFGELEVVINDVTVSPRYHTEILIVKWSVREERIPGVWSQFPLKFNDNALIKAGIHPVYEADEMDISLSDKLKVAKALLLHVRFEEEESKFSGNKLEIFFADDVTGSDPLSATVIWTHEDGKFST